MVSDPAAYVDSDSCYLRLSDPHACCSGQSLPFKPEFRESVDDGTFQCTDIRDNIALPLPEIKNGITHDLAGAVIRYVPTAITVMKFDTGSLKHFRAGQKIFVSAVPAHCDYVGMLDEQQSVRNQTLLALFYELLLD